MSRSEFKPLVVRQDPEEKVTAEVMATAIRAIGNGMREMQRHLTDDAISVLVWAAIPKSYGISQKTVETVLSGIDNLEKKYLKKSHA